MQDGPPTGGAALPPALHALAARQRGVLSRAQLAEAGISRQQIRDQLRARRWRCVGLAVVLHRGPPDRAQQHWAACVQTRGRGALVGWSALEAAGLRGWHRDEIHVVVPRGWTVRPIPGLVVHESRRFVRERDVALASGPPRTTAARAAIDAACWSRSPRTAVGLLAAAVQQRLCPVDALAAELARAGRVRHCALLRRSLLDLAGGADSLAEIDMAALVLRAGLPEPRRQTQRLDAAGRRRYIDLEVDLADGSLLMIEVDGAHHLDAAQAWADQQRHNDLAGTGRIQVRFPAFVIRHEPDAVVRSLRKLSARADARASEIADRSRVW